MFIRLYLNINKNNDSNTCELELYNTNSMYHGLCKKCALLRWHRMPKQCNFNYDTDIHRNEIRFRDGWCSEDTNLQLGMCKRCSIDLYNYLSRDNCCLRKFVVKNDSYSLCLAPVNPSKGENSMLLCDNCAQDKTF